MLCPWASLGKNTGVGCNSFLRGIFPTKGSNPDLLHCRQFLYHFSHQGSFSFLIKNNKEKSAAGQPHWRPKWKEKSVQLIPSLPRTPIVSFIMDNLHLFLLLIYFTKMSFTVISAFLDLPDPPQSCVQGEGLPLLPGSSEERAHCWFTQGEASSDPLLELCDLLYHCRCYCNHT